MSVPAFISHQVDGRVRIRIPSKQRDAGYFSMVRESLARCPGVDSVAVQPLTGGTLVLHHTAVTAIAEYAEEHGLFIICDRAADPVPVVHEISNRFSTLNRGLTHSSAGKVDLATAAFFLFCGAGFLQLLRRNVLPAGITLLWYAASLLPKNASSSVAVRTGKLHDVTIM